MSRVGVEAASAPAPPQPLTLSALSASPEDAPRPPPNTHRLAYKGEVLGTKEPAELNWEKRSKSVRKAG